MPRASGTSGVAVTTAVTIFESGEGSDGDPCTTFAVRARSGNAAVNVPQLHGAAKVLVPEGETVYFRCGSFGRLQGITKVTAEGVDGEATIDYWVAAIGA